MTVLLLRLAGPLQAWGVKSKFSIRATELAPTKSASRGGGGGGAAPPHDPTPSRTC